MENECFEIRVKYYTKNLDLKRERSIQRSTYESAHVEAEHILRDLNDEDKNLTDIIIRNELLKNAKLSYGHLEVYILAHKTRSG